MKKKRNRIIAVLLMLVTVISMIGGAGVFADELFPSESSDNEKSLVNINVWTEGGSVSVKNDEDKEWLIVENEGFSEEITKGTHLYLSIKSEEGYSLDTYILNGNVENNLKDSIVDNYLDFEVSDNSDLDFEFVKNPDSSNNNDTSESTESNSNSENSSGSSNDSVIYDGSEVHDEKFWEEYHKRVTTGKVLGTAVVVNKNSKPGMQRSAVGANVTITPGASHSYGGWGTCEFSCATSDGTFMGYCAQPNKPTPSGTYTISELSDTASLALAGRTGRDLKIALMFGADGPYASQAPALFGNCAADKVYAYLHAWIGIMYSGDTNGLTATQVQAVTGINVFNEPARIEDSKAYKVYVAYNDSQDIVWLEKNPIGKCKLYKHSTDPQISNNNPCYSLDGGTWGVYSDSSCATQVGTLTTSNGGVSNEIELEQGTYYVKEITPPKGFATHLEGQSPEVKEVTITAGQTAEVHFYDTPHNDPINILIEKQDKNGILNQGNADLAGAVFQVDYYASTTVTKEQIQDGSVVPKDSYLFKTIYKEFTKPDGSINARTFISLNLPECYVGSPTGSELYTLLGATTFPVGTIAVWEKQPPEGYHVEGSVIQDPNSNSTITDNLVVLNILPGELLQTPLRVYQTPTNANEVDRGNLVIYKRDKETGLVDPQGGATLAGAVFSITNQSTNPVSYEGKTYAVGQEIKKISTEWNDSYNAFVATINGLPYGTYRAIEVTPPEGYQLAGRLSVEGTIREHNQTVVLTGSPYDCILDEVIRGGVKIKKRDFETKLDEAREDTKLEGAVFEIVSKNRQAVVVDDVSYAYGEVVKTITADAQGIAKTGRGTLPYGSYTIQEKTAPEGFLHEGKLSVNFNIRKHGEIVDLTSSANAIMNKPVRGDLEFLKVKGKPEGEEKDELDPLKGARFEIVSKRTGQVMYTVESDENGIVTTKGMGDPRGALVYGTYIVREIFVPEGYEKIEPFEFKIRNEGVTVQYIYQEDKLIESPIQVVKKDIETGKVIPLANTTFELLDSNHNIISLEQFYPNHTVLSQFKTDESGSFTLPEKLTWGTYYLREVQAPNGYLKGAELQFTVEHGRNWSDPLVIEYGDENAMGKIHIVKKDSLTNNPLEGAYFEIRAKKDIRTNDGTVRHYKGDLIETISTNSQGIAESKLLYIGEYTLQEKSTPDGYTLDDTVRDFSIVYVNQDTPVYVYNIELKNKPTEFDLFKKDIDNVKLQGITFDITNNTTGEKITRVTDANGNINIKYVKHGSYKIEEKATLPGYVLDTYPRYFVVSPEGYIKQVNNQGVAVSGSKEKSNYLSIEWINDYTKVDFSKHDITGTKEIKGATLQVISDSGQVVYEWVTGTVPHRIVKIPIGSYTLHESVTPEGYVTSNDVPFTVLSTGNVQRFKMTDKQVFATKVDVKDKPLAGATLTVTDQSGNVRDTWVTTDKPHAISGLHVGNTYVLSETNTPVGYATALPITFKVEDNLENQTIKMVNKRVDITKKDTKGAILPGAKLAVTDRAGLVVDEWTSDGSTHYVSGLMVGESYILKEVQPPRGYVKASNIEFTVSTENKDQHYEMSDKQVRVTKTDVFGEKEVEGAILRVVNAKGETVDEWTSTKTPHFVDGLEVNNAYTLIEVTAPEGYVKASSIDFYVPEDGKIQTVHMVDKRLSVSKKEVTGDKELPGATLTVKDTDGNTIEEWVSSDKPHYVSGLEVGKTYTLTETITPLGYVTASTITFTVKDDGKDQLVTMIDKQVRVSKTDITGEKELSGAKLIVRDSEDNVVDEWASNGTPHFVSGLRVNETYQLEELQAPNGYVIASTITFDVPEDNKIQKVHMIDKQVQVSKTDVTGEEELEGAKLTVKDKKGNIVDEWVSGKKPHFVNGLIVNHEYTLTETTTPEGYVTASTIKFNVPENNKLQKIHMVDKRVEVSKTDVTGEKELPGATLTVTDTKGKVIDEWVSSDETHFVKGLKVNKKYILTETNTPKGYVKATSIEFEVPEDGKDQKVHMVDKQVFVTKTDVTGDEEVIGAHLIVKDKEGNIIDEWVSGKEPHPVSGLEAGKDYILIEEQAPGGYVVAEEIEFTVEDDGKIQHVEMHDKQVFINKSDLIKSDEDLIKPVVPNDKEEEDTPDIEDPDEDISGDISGDTSGDVSGDAVESDGKFENKDTKYVKFSKYPFKGFIDKVLDFLGVDDGSEEEPTMADSGEGIIEKVVSPKSDSEPKPDKEISGDVSDTGKLWADNPVVKNGKFSTDEKLNSRRYLMGTKLQVQDLEGNVVDEWVTDGNTYAVSNLVIGQTYNLVEVEATTGYVKSVPYQFTVEKTDENQFILMKDKQVILYKKDMAGEELEGAKITISDEEGNVVDTWISGKEPHAIENLEEGKKYKFKEESAPNGYIVVEEFEFIVDESLTNLHIEVTDDHTRTVISKQDVTTGKELPGAQLTVFDSEGNKVETWTSSDKPHLIERLKPGIYKLHEDLAPIGYKIASDVTFEVKAVPETLKVVMKDEVKPQVQIVKTGENVIVIVLILIILLVIVGFYWKRRR